MELDSRSKLRIEIEQCFAGHKFPNTKIVDRIKALIDKQCVAARIDELNKMPSPAYIGADGIRLELIAEYKNHRLAELKKEAE